MSDFGYTECFENESLPPVVQGTPGAGGSPGAAGAAGTNGKDAFTYTTASFVIPASNATVVVHVEHSEWIAVGQMVYVEDAGTFEVTDYADGTVTLKNDSTEVNTASATTITTGAKVSPAGRRGATGTGISSPLAIANGGTAATAKGAAFDNLAPMTTKGGLAVYGELVDGGGTVTGHTNMELAPGADGLPLLADSTQHKGLRYGAIDLSTAAVTGSLPPAHGGIGDTSGIHDVSLVVFHDGTPFTGLKVGLNETREPGSTDDESGGFSIGSRWVLLADAGATPPVDSVEFVCLDASTGAAVWKPTTLAAGGAVYTRRAVGSGTTAVTRDDSLLAVTVNTATLNLPAGSSWPNHYLVIKHEGNAAPTITITPNGSDTIEGAASYTLSVKGGVKVLYWGGGQWRFADTRSDALDLSQGGTNQGSWTANTFVRVSADGTKLESIPASGALSSAVLSPSISADSAISGLTISSTYSQSEVQTLRDRCEDLRDSVASVISVVNTLLANFRSGTGTKLLS